MRVRVGGIAARAACMVLLVLATTGLAAHSVLDFDIWMQRIDDGSQDLQRHIAARDAEAALAAARELDELYGLMEKFFVDRGDAADAERYSREGRAFAQGAIRNLRAKKYPAAKADALALARGCRACHFNYKPL